MREINAETLKIRVMLRLEELRGERKGDSDLDVGYRIGLLTATNTLDQVYTDLEAEEDVR